MRIAQRKQAQLFTTQVSILHCKQLIGCDCRALLRYPISADLQRAETRQTFQLSRLVPLRPGTLIAEVF